MSKEKNTPKEQPKPNPDQTRGKDTFGHPTKPDLIKGKVPTMQNPPPPPPKKEK